VIDEILGLSKLQIKEALRENRIFAAIADKSGEDNLLRFFGSTIKDLNLTVYIYFLILIHIASGNKK
jgi:hypothetical protein